MTTNVWKMFVSDENEERWLNRMAAQGKALIRYTWCHYRFEDSAPNKFAYRIELLPDSPNKPKGLEFLAFLKDSGIECVSTYMNWAYLRKPAADGPFELFTDNASKLAQRRRVATLYLTLALVLSAGCLTNLALVLYNSGSDSHLWIVNLIAVIVSGVVAGLFWNLWVQVRRQCATLTRNQSVDQ